MRKALRIQIVVMVFLICAVAMEFMASAGTGGFSVMPVLPENQAPETSGFFDLTMRPAQKQDLVIAVKNSGDKEMTVSIEAITATTNRNGIINYTSPAASDETLRYGFADIAEVPEKNVTIPAGESKSVTVSVTMPEEEFDGIILGSIRLTKELSEKEKAEGGMILSRYSYVLSVRLKETNAVIEPEFMLGGVSAELVNYRASIVANIRNPKPKLMKGAMVSAKIYQKGSGTATIDTSKSVDFAPYSVFPFSMAAAEEGYGINAGQYTAKIEVEYEGEKWSFEEEFEIKPEQAAEINQKAVNQSVQRQAGDASKLPIWAIITIIAGGLILIAAAVLIIVTIRGKNNQDKEEDEDNPQID